MIQNSPNLKLNFYGYFILIFLLQQTAFGQIRSGAAFLKILPGARQQGLSSSITSLIDEPYAFYANPAATAFNRESQWSLTYTKWIVDIHNISLNYGRTIRTPWSKRTGVNIGINYQGIKQFDSSGGQADPSTASDVLFSAGIANPVFSKNFSIGANFKYLESNLDQYSASSFIIDFGSLYRTNRFNLFGNGAGPFKYGIFSIGFAVTHLGNPLTFIAADTPLPLTNRFGAAFYTGTHSGLQLQIAADYREILDEVSTFSVGTEISWRQRISLRGGYNFNDRMISKFSFGLSLRLDDAKSTFHNSVAGRNNALGFDFVALENNDFFSDAYRATITYIPIGPEKFYFATRQNMVYTTSDSIPLAWEITRDPDLYDDANFGYLIAREKEDLADFIQKSENWETDFALALENPVAFDILSPELIQKDAPKYLHTINPLPPGDYYWTTWAFDNDRHVRFAKNYKDNIQHFSVTAASVDTCSDLMLKKEIAADPVRLDIHFDFDIDTLDYHSQEQLNMIAVALSSEEFKNFNVELAGHTDIRGTDEYNQSLSQGRVTSAKKYIVDEMGIEESRLNAVGYGESRPIIRNAQWEVEHAVNRRVELKFTEKSSKNLEPPKVVLHDGKYDYKLKIENIAKVQARNIVVIDVIPAFFTTSDFNIEPKVMGDTLIWYFDTVDPGKSIELNFRATAPSFIDTNPYKMLSRSYVYAPNDTNFQNNSDSTSIYVIGMPDSVLYYDTDKQEYEKALLKWANYLKSIPQVDVSIEGHADDQGDSEKDLKYSEEMAEKAKKLISDWLVKNVNVTDESLNISTKGWGAQKPVAPNDTIENMQKNRRLIIRLRPCK